MACSISKIASMRRTASTATGALDSFASPKSFPRPRTLCGAPDKVQRDASYLNLPKSPRKHGTRHRR
jgi:hypothetical protein